MPKKRLSEREARRIATLKRKRGDDFYSINGQHSGKFTKTTFNSVTGSAAAKLKWKKYREEKARKIREHDEKIKEMDDIERQLNEEI